MQCKNPKWLCYMTEAGEAVTGSHTMIYTTDYMVSNRKLIKAKVIIPCGLCMACRINYTEQWTSRIMTEAQRWTHNYFLTLTYDENNVPENRIADSNGEVVVDFNGKEIIPHPLQKIHLQDFNKRVRRRWDYQYHWQGIRHFGVGEYGDEKGRPHYHEILFNFPIHDGKEICTTTRYRQGQKYQYKEYFSEELQNLWPYGMVRYGECNEITARYIAGYALKKVKGKEAETYYAERGLTPEFSISSRKPGIGFETFDEKRQEILEKDLMVIKDPFGGKLIPIPKGFKQAAIRHTAVDKNGKLIKSRYPEEEIELNRKILAEHRPKKEAAAEAIEAKMLFGHQSTAPMSEQLRINVENAESKIRTKKGVL